MRLHFLPRTLGILFQFAVLNPSRMDEDEPSFKCSCGRDFPRQGPLTHHRTTCSGSQKRLAGVLKITKDIFSARKKRRREAVAAGVTAAGTQGEEQLGLDAPYLQLATPTTIETTPLPQDYHRRDNSVETVAVEVEVRGAHTSLNFHANVTIVCRYLIQQ